MSFKPRFMATALSLLPHRDLEAACLMVRHDFPEAPFGPVLTRSIRMWVEQMPCLNMDRVRKEISFQVSGREGELSRFYEHVLAHDLDYFAISPELNPGIYRLAEMYRAQPWPELKVINFSIPGLYSLALLVRDENGMPALYNDTLRDVMVKAIGMKAKWYNRMVHSLFPGVRTQYTIGNGGLAMFLSAGGTGGWERIKRDYNELIAICGADLSSIHCCANFDWSLLMQINTDSINFDAYQYGDTMSYYPDDLRRFLARGGTISWGIIPTTGSGGDISQETVDSLAQRLERAIRLIIDRGIDEQALLEASWVTPTCEPATLSVDMAERVCHFTREVSQRLRPRYFG